MNGPLHKVIPKRSSKDHLRILGRVLDSTICTICHDYMLVPVMTACGHNYCYDCLSKWLNNSKDNMTELSCPQCRTPIETEPVLNVALQQIVDLMIDIAAEDPEKRDSAELKALLLQRELAVAEYKTDLSEDNLFNGVFKNTAVAVIDDDDDGIARCSNCHWEIEGPVCPNCNARIRNYNAGAHNFDEIDREEYSEGELEEVERDLDTYRAESARRVHDLEAEDADESFSSEMDRQWPERTPRNFMHGGDQEDDDEDRGSIDSFIVDDDEEEGLDSDAEQDDSRIETRGKRFRRVSVSNSEESRDSDFYEHNDEGYASGDSLDSHSDVSKESDPLIRKKRLIVLDSDSE